MRFPALQQNLRGILTCEMEKVCREEAFLKDEPNRLEIALRRCKKLTGTLVTLKRYFTQKIVGTKIFNVEFDANFSGLQVFRNKGQVSSLRRKTLKKPLMSSPTTVRIR